MCTSARHMLCKSQVAVTGRYPANTQCSHLGLDRGGIPECTSDEDQLKTLFRRAPRPEHPRLSGTTERLLFAVAGTKFDCPPGELFSWVLGDTNQQTLGYNGADAIIGEDCQNAAPDRVAKR